MRIAFIIIAIVFVALTIAFTILPMGTIALIPVALAFLFSFFAFLKSKERKRIFSKWLMFFVFVLFLVIVAKDVFVKDKVVTDQKFQLEKQNSQQEAQKELEELEGLK